MTDELLPAELLSDAPWSDTELDVIAEGHDDTDVEPLRARELADGEHAAWALAKVAKLEAQLQELNSQAAAWRARIDEWQAENARPLASRAAFLSERLEHYALAVRARDDVKTLRLPSGDVATTAHAAKVVITDEALLAAWLHPRLKDDEWEAIANVSVSLRVSELRKVLDVADVAGETVVLLRGERVPDVEVTSASVTAKVKPSPITHVLDR